MRSTMRAIAVAMVLSSTGPAFSGPDGVVTDPVCEREMIGAAARHGVPLGMLYAVGLTESGRKHRLNAFALNVEGKAAFPVGLAQATALVRRELARGRKLIDIGCMQINHHYHREHFATLEAMFEPARNVDYAARFLKTLHAREGSWTMAVARYHAGPNNNPAQKRYVCAVIRNMVTSRFGSWTPESRQFCGEAIATSG